jgi:transposase
VQIDLDTLPDDPAILQRMLRDAVHQHGALQAENDKLRLLIQRLPRHQFGRRSEQLGPDQLQLGLEDLEQTVAENQAGQDAAGAQQGRRSAPPRRNHDALPVHLPRYEVLIDGGMVTEALVAHVMVSKFCDSLPLYRQAQMLARQGVTLDRSTLSNWVGRACWWLTPLYDLIVGTALSAAKLFADDTTLPVLDPGRGRTRTGRLWCYAVDDRPWCGPSHPVAAYVYTEDRKGLRPAGHLAAFRGVLQVDDYPGFKRLAGDHADAAVGLAFCRAHMRRYFYEFHVSTQSPLAAGVLAQIRALYAIEGQIRGHPAEHRRQVRQARSRPVVEALHAWLLAHQGRVSATSDLAKAIRYALRHWPGLTVFLDDGRVEMDTNVVERAIRPVALNRKNALFAGSDGGARHWAMAMTLIQTAKLNGVEPMAWLTDVLERVVSGRTKATELDTLLPWNWKPSGDLALAAAA